MNNNESSPCPFPMRQNLRYFVERRMLARLRFFAEYERDVNNWYRYGDGRPVDEGGKSHRFPYCIHGASLWTDYDNICGGCEWGDSYWDFAREVTEAAREAVWADEKSKRRAELAVPLLMQSGPDALPADVRNELSGWVLAPLSNF